MTSQSISTKISEPKAVQDKLKVHFYYESENTDDLRGFVMTFRGKLYDIYEAYDSYYNDTHVGTDMLNMSSADDVGLEKNVVKVKDSKEQLKILKAIVNHLESDLKGNYVYHVYYHLHENFNSEAEKRLLKELKRKIN